MFCVLIYNSYLSTENDQRLTLSFKILGMNYTTDDLDILGYRESVVLPKVRAVSK